MKTTSIPLPRGRAYILAGLLLGALGLLYWLTPYYSTQFLWEVRKSLFWTAPLLVIAAAAGAMFARVRSERAAIAAGVLGVLGAIGVLIWGTAIHSYLQEKTYASSIHVTDDKLDELNKRIPYSVAQAQSRTTLANLPGADLLTDSTRYNPAGDTFTTLAKGRQLLGNYSAVAQQKFPLTGRSTPSQCQFADDSDKALGGLFTHNLGRAINSERRGVNWTESDAYGICDNGTPEVIVPLKKQTGWLIVTEVPAGAAIYNGKTGDLRIVDDLSKVPGTVYPLSLAAHQRESSDALGTWMQWFRNQIGWKTADGEVNSANTAEFVVGRHDGGLAYVTPLSNQGNSTGIAAISTLNGRDSQAGRLTELTVHRMATPWVSIEAIESRIKADYQDIPNWQTIKVQEIVPIDSTRWIATLGNDQNTQYRIEGTGDLSGIPGLEGQPATCLYQGTDDKPKRCGTLALRGDNGVGGQYGTNNPGGNPPPPAGGATAVPGDLAQLDNQQLAELLRRIADELAKRKN